MLVKDFLLQFDKEDVIERLFLNYDYLFEYVEEEKIYEAKEKAFNAYLKSFENIEKINPIINNEDVLVVVKNYDEFYSDKYECSLINIEYSKDGYYKFDGEKCIERYGMIFTPWEEILGFELCELSIVEIDNLDLAAALLREITRMGFTSNFQKERVKEEISILEERVATFKEEDCLEANEVFDKLREKYSEFLDFEEDEESEEDEEKRMEEIKINVEKMQNELLRYKKFISENY